MYCLLIFLPPRFKFPRFLLKPLFCPRKKGKSEVASLNSGGADRWMGQCRTATYLLHLQVAQLGGRTPDFYRFPIKASGKKRERGGGGNWNFFPEKVQSRAKKREERSRKPWSTWIRSSAGKTKTEIKETRRQKKRKEDNKKNNPHPTLSFPDKSETNFSLRARHPSFPPPFYGAKCRQDFFFCTYCFLLCFAQARDGRRGRDSYLMLCYQFLPPPSSLGFNSKSGMHISNWSKKDSCVPSFVPSPLFS